MKKNLGLIIVLLVLGLSLPRVEAQYCTGTLYSNLIPGDTALIASADLLNVRAEPSLSGERLTQIAPDTEFFVVGGPVCADDYAWYEIRLDNTQTGWVAEADHEDYWLGKLPRQYTTYEQLADPKGSIPNLTFTYPEASITRIDVDSAQLFGSVHRGGQIILRTLSGASIFITALPFADFEVIPGGGYDRAEVLQMFVEAWSDEALETMLYPYPNSAGVGPPITALMDFQEFQNGRGFSYVASYSDVENLAPVTRDDFWYVFHGLTDDGAWFVNVTMQLGTPELPAGPPINEDDMTEYFAGYLPWIDEIRDFLGTQEGASYAPLLGVVKSLVYSLEVE